MLTVLHKFRAHPALSLVLCSVLWSTGGVLIKLVDWNPLAIAGARSAISVVVICAVLGRIPRKFTRDGVIAAVSYAATMTLFVIATKMTTAANAILLQYTNPLYVIVLSRLVLKEKTYRIDYVTVAGVFGGMIVFFANGLSISANAGNLIAALAGVAFALTALFMRRQKDGNPEDSFVLAHAITFVISLPAMIGAGLPSAAGFGGLLLLGVLQIGIPSVLYSAGISRIPAVSAVLITMIEPVMNPVWVALFYGETPSVQTVIGGGIILFFIGLRALLRSTAVRKPEL